ESFNLIKKLKKWTSIYDIYSLKKVIENDKISHKMLVESIKLLADSSVFDYYSIEAISELELHLRTLVSLIEVICKYEIRIQHNVREKIYAELGNFAEKHFRSTEIYEQGFNKVFRAQFEDFNPPSKSMTSSNLNISNDRKVYKDGKRNYNIDFLLLYLRDTLHCMRDDENKFSEICKRMKAVLRIGFGITSGFVKKGASHGANLPTGNDIELLFKQAFTWKYPISNWYYEWRIILELHSYIQECSLPPKYGENLLLECLWHCVSKSWSNPISQSEFLTNRKHHINHLLGMEPLAFPHSLWFGALDIAQALIAKTQKESTLGICYYLALESLKRAPSSFIRYKAIEILIKLSNRDILYYAIIDNDFENYKSPDSAKLHYMIEAIREKSSQDGKLVDTNKNELKEKAIKANSLRSTHMITQTDDFISEVVTIELSCPVTLKISKNFQILPCCKHPISSETLQQITNNKSQPTCLYCREIIDLNSVINLPQSEIYQGIRNYLPDDNINVTQDHNENFSSDDEEIDIFKLKSQQKCNDEVINLEVINRPKLKSQQRFRLSDSTVKKFFKTPKFLYSSLRKKANIAYKLGDFETFINALTEVLEHYPTSYSLQCDRAKA
ncbi:27832_t:CDS:1, partial [Gigaspora margarita]